ncbi:hypothetical protein EW146_g3171 [Bondarzewia mesenterica]|uniref:NADP-dependent oxidoreductase domain-containing protein n=1 Tax=Bondarzewia mesenterica TaxID=1095465 RepID=A0A4S4M080_9AGAM|nr:hypothetical protein EW146_g3171 [Bondarzewia mesenterica]
MPQKLPTRKIGATDVSAIGYGAMGIAIAYGDVGSDEERFKVLDAVYKSGCTNWDTADIYGDSEELIGKWQVSPPRHACLPFLTHICRFKRTGKRNEIFLATKFGFYPPTGKPVDGSPEYARKCFERSLQRLGTDHIDLFYLHRTEIDQQKSVAAMAEFVKAGKLKYIGLSEVSEAALRRAHAVHPISALQVEYSPFTLDIEDPKIGLLKAARELGVTIIAYSPLGRGLLTGRYRSPDDFEENDFRRTIPRFAKENFPNILKLVDDLKQIGEKHSATPAQVTLAWLLGQGEDVIPIPGTQKIKYVEENLGALKIKLTPEELKAIREAAERSDAAVESRYSSEVELLCDIVGGISSQRDLLNVRAANKVFHLLATPRAFRTVRVKNLIKSANSFKCIVTSKALMPFIKEVRFRDNYTDEDGDMIGGESTLRDVSICGGQRERRRWGTHPSYSKLDTLVLNLYPDFLEEASYEILEPSDSLKLQLAIFKALSTNSDTLSLTSLTINNLFAFHNELYDNPSFLQIFSHLSRLHVTVVSNTNTTMDGGAPFEDPFVEFWEKTIPHLILASPAASLASSLAKSLTSLTIHSDQDVGLIPRISFSELTYPVLTSLALQHILFVDNNHDISAAAATGVEDFIVRHGSTLTHLELRFCRILMLDDEGTSRRFWSQIWSRFAHDLKVLVSLHISEEMDESSRAMLHDLDRILRYVILDEGFGYVPIFKPMMDEAKDDLALQALQEVVAARRSSTSRAL